MINPHEPKLPQTRDTRCPDTGHKRYLTKQRSKSNRAGVLKLFGPATPCRGDIYTDKHIINPHPELILYFNSHLRYHIFIIEIIIFSTEIFRGPQFENRGSMRTRCTVCIQSSFGEYLFTLRNSVTSLSCT